MRVQTVGKHYFHQAQNGFHFEMNAFHTKALRTIKIWPGSTVKRFSTSPTIFLSFPTLSPLFFFSFFLYLFFISFLFFLLIARLVISKDNLFVPDSSWDPCWLDTCKCLDLLGVPHEYSTSTCCSHCVLLINARCSWSRVRESPGLPWCLLWSTPPGLTNPFLNTLRYFFVHVHGTACTALAKTYH